jgi:hypothetical protein
MLLLQVCYPVIFVSVACNSGTDAAQALAVFAEYNRRVSQLTMLVIVGPKIIFHTACVGIFLIFLRTKLHMPSSNASLIIGIKPKTSRSQWPRGLSHEPSSSARTMGLWIRIQIEAWMSLCVYSVFVLFCV